MKLEALHDPFPYGDIEWRLARAGEKDGKIWAICLPYITSRAIMDRLDLVCGPENWQSEFRDGNGHLLGGIGVRVGDEWVWKWDGAGMLEPNDGLSVTDAGKGDFSNALKRVAVQWGIGRYLYRLSESFAVVHEDGTFRGKTKDGKRFRWNPPGLPAFALPEGDTSPEVPEPNPADRVAPTPSQAPAQNGVFGCLKCGGEVWDNRADKQAGKVNPRYPDLKCKDKECGWVLWLDGWEKDLLRDLDATFHTQGTLSEAERDDIGAMIRSGNPLHMRSALNRIREAAQ